MRLNARGPRDACFRGFARIEIVMVAADDLLPPLLSDFRREQVTRAIKLARLKPFEQVRDYRVSRVEFAQCPNQRLVLQDAQLANRQSFAERKLHRFRNHRARGNLRVVIVDALGERVPDAQQVDQFRQRIMAQHSVFLEIHHESSIFNDERLEDAHERQHEHDDEGRRHDGQRHPQHGDPVVRARHAARLFQRRIHVAKRGREQHHLDRQRARHQVHPDDPPPREDVERPLLDQVQALQELVRQAVEAVEDHDPAEGHRQGRQEDGDPEAEFEPVLARQIGTRKKPGRRGAYQ